MGDNVSTIHNENEEVLMAVKMPHGMSDRVKIHNTVLQGTKLGPLHWKVTINEIGERAPKFPDSYIHITGWFQRH